MRKPFSLIIFIFSSFAAPYIYGQTARPTPNVQAQRQQQQRQIQTQAEQERRFEQLRIVSENLRVSVSPPSEVKNIAPLPAVKLNKEQKALLKPDIQDSNAYAAFLAQPKTGLIKLFSDLGCEGNSAILRADAECLKWIPNSGFYSFRRNKYIGEPLADIRYKDGFFISDGILAQGILTALGNVALENVSLADNQLRFLSEYKPEPQNQAAAAQAKKLKEGIKIGNYFYRNVLPAAGNMTYALRVIAYRGSIYVPFQGRLFNMLDGDARKDVIIVFRAVRKNSDGSMTLLWKELDRRESPKLVFQKKDENNKPANFQE